MPANLSRHQSEGMGIKSLGLSPYDKNVGSQGKLPLSSKESTISPAQTYAKPRIVPAQGLEVGCHQMQGQGSVPRQQVPFPGILHIKKCFPAHSDSGWG